MQNSQIKGENIVRPQDVICKKHPNRLFILLLVLFIFFTLMSAAYLYLDIYRPLNTHYGSIVSIITDIHDTLIIRTLKINTFFFILISAGVIILGILYTHRICGPLHRIQLFAKSVAEGKLDEKVTFRKKDAIHPFGDIFNEVTDNYSERIEKLSVEIQNLRSALEGLKSLTEEGKGEHADFSSALETDKVIKKLLGDIRL